MTISPLMYSAGSMDSGSAQNSSMVARRRLMGCSSAMSVACSRTSVAIAVLLLAVVSLSARGVLLGGILSRRAAGVGGRLARVLRADAHATFESVGGFEHL